MIDTTPGRWAVYDAGARFWCAQIVGGGKRLRLRLVSGTPTSRGREHVCATFADKADATRLLDELNILAAEYQHARTDALTSFNLAVRASVATATEGAPK